MAHKKNYSHGSTPTGEYPKDAGMYGEPHFRKKTAKAYGKLKGEHHRGLAPVGWKSGY